MERIHTSARRVSDRVVEVPGVDDDHAVTEEKQTQGASRELVTPEDVIRRRDGSISLGGNYLGRELFQASESESLSGDVSDEDREEDVSHYLVNQHRDVVQTL